MNRAARYRLLICALALSGLLTGCFLFPAAVKHETLLAPNDGQGPATQNPIVSSLAGRDHSEFLASELLFHPTNQTDTQHQGREPSI